MSSDTGSTRKPETITLTVKTKWLWVFLGIVLALLAVAPVVAASLPAAPSASGAPSSGSSGSSSSAPSATPNCSNPCVIVIVNSQFGTVQPIIVKAGTTVTWQNKDDTQHTTTSDTGIWDSGLLNPGQSFSYTFSTPGTYPYHCNIHPMTGTIEVVS